MGNAYTSVSVTSYNSNPPADDGSQVAANRVQWSTHITKIGNPLKTAIEAINTNANTAFTKMFGHAGVTATATNYTVTAADQGKLVKVTASATITTPDATVVGSPFSFGVLNLHSGNITLDGSGSQTVDGVASIVIPSGFGVILYTDGTNWFTTGQNFVTAQPVAAGFKNLVIQNNSGTPNTSIDIDADAVTVETSTGKAYRLNSVNLTIDCTTTGANALDAGGLANTTFYSTWVIYNPTTDTTAGLASTSETSPALPSGYTAKARLGWMITTGSAVFHRTIQKGRRAQYVVSASITTALPTLFTGVQGTYSATTPTYAAASVSTLVPSTASAIGLFVVNNYNGGSNGNILVAPNNNYGGQNSANAPQFVNAMTSGEICSSSGWMMLESTNLYVVGGAAGAAAYVIGWEDNI